jgi:hypothetical protein
LLVEGLPPYLADYSSFKDFLDRTFDGLSPMEKGRRFAAIVERVVPLSDLGKPYGTLRLQQESHDDGVDLLSEPGESGNVLCVQSRLKVQQKADFDSVISHFEHYEEKSQQGQAQLFDNEASQFVFMLVTSSRLTNVAREYRKSRLSSRTFYERLLEEERLMLMDGDALLARLQRSYRRSYESPDSFELPALQPWLAHDNVFVGLVPGREVVRLYETHGEALFFENIRDFLGTKGDNAERVNLKIVETARDAPAKMLERNNGITIRCSSATALAENRLLMESAAIVNGCQTAMCLVNVGETLSEECSVLIKVVVTPDAWDIARSANLQNQVALRDLDVARWLRPQSVSKAAADRGLRLDPATTAGRESDLLRFLDAAVTEELRYDDVKYLFLGLFSRKPNNLFDDNYTKLRFDALKDLETAGPDTAAELYDTLFLIEENARRLMAKCSEVFADEHDKYFKRFSDKPKYFAFITLLALCGATEGQLGSDETDGRQLLDFVGIAHQLLENDPARFERAYIAAYEIVAGHALEVWDATTPEDRIQQHMSTRVESANFAMLLTKVAMRLKADAAR